MLSHRSFLINLIVKFEFWLELTLVMEMINNPCVPSLVYAFPYMTCNSIWIPSFDITTSWGNWDLYSEWEKGCDCECVGGGETEIRRRVTRKTMLGSSATESSPLAPSTTSILLFLMHKGYHENYTEIVYCFIQAGLHKRYIFSTPKNRSERIKSRKLAFCFSKGWLGKASISA